MRKIRVWLGASALAGSVAFASLAMGQESKDKKLSPQDLPRPVMEAAMARLPGAQITAAEKENENGNVVYDLELTQKGRKFEMDVKEDGTIMEIEKEIKKPSAAVIKAVKDKFPDAQIKIVMEVDAVKGKQETPQNYEVTLTTGGKEKEVVVALDGSSVKEEAAETPEKK